MQYTAKALVEFITYRENHLQLNAEEKRLARQVLDQKHPSGRFLQNLCRAYQCDTSAFFAFIDQLGNDIKARVKEENLSQEASRKMAFRKAEKRRKNKRAKTVQHPIKGKITNRRTPVESVTNFAIAKRHARLWTRREFAKAVGISLNTIDGIENKTLHYVRPSTIQTLSTYFHCTVQDIETFEAWDPLPSPADVGRFLRDFRVRHNLSQCQMAVKLTLKQKDLSRLETEKTAMPTFKMLKLICDRMPCSLSDIKGAASRPEPTLMFSYMRDAITYSRSKHGLSRKQMSKESGIYEATLKDLENLEASKISSQVLQRLCDYLNCNPSSFIGLKGPS